jgi:hypothetical protein
LALTDATEMVLYDFEFGERAEQAKSGFGAVLKARIAADFDTVDDIRLPVKSTC